ncbi:MAG: PTS sugar transporter subunit IIC [Bacillales bacterium]|jgi:uncharacterized membrane protein|nr:PTS sugar transporter subunit IIC [Bacillales bacterium]
MNEEENIKELEVEIKEPHKPSIIKQLLTRYFLVAMSGMALGLFASLIVGIIIKQLGRIPFLDFLQIQNLYSNILSKSITGGAIGAGIAIKLKYKNMLLISSVVVGVLGYLVPGNMNGGNPLGCFLIVVIAGEIGNLVNGKTKGLDIIITPLVVILIGHTLSLLICPPILQATSYLGEAINKATELSPFLMGIVLSVSVGVILTSPLSSAAICMSLGLSGIAAGAAAVGCCVNMVGFAVCSVKKNGLSSLVSIGLGTSMLQFPNTLRKPIIWLPIIITSAILGPISTVAFQMVNTAEGAGMGTSGLVGQFGALEALASLGKLNFFTVFQLLLLHFILPVLLVFSLNYLLTKIGLIKDEYYKLQEN